MPDMEGIIVAVSARLPYGTPVEKAEELRELLEASLAEANSQFGNAAVQGRYTNVGSTNGRRPRQRTPPQEPKVFPC